jgi:hypothetical protein
VDDLRAKNAYDDAMRIIQQDPQGLFNTHVNAWEDVYNRQGFALPSGQIYQDANDDGFKLAQRLYASFYNIYSAIPLTFDSQFYGVSPAGLAYGGLRPEFFNETSQNSQFTSNRAITEAYGGHVMYNQELWILPLVSLFSSEMPKTLIHSRMRSGYNREYPSMYVQAQEAAKDEGYPGGLRYPWEQGDYGIDVSPFEDARDSKIHVSADLSFGIRSYLRMSHDRTWLQQQISSDASTRGEEFLNDIAKYWFERMKLDSFSNQFEIDGVSFGERSQSRKVDNEFYTNYMAGLSMDTFKYALYLGEK